MQFGELFLKTIVTEAVDEAAKRIAQSRIEPEFEQALKAFVQAGRNLLYAMRIHTVA